ncbi:MULTISPECIES: hypothetical protein [unclassified Nocardia]|uniref:hypothetical protein n=1 Tax=unclassified Nocardia TaxID=2637762 RepID=UPI001CE48BA2|nr:MULTISPECIES: hypothetical protein [unclassified Nocardia]
MATRCANRMTHASARRVLVDHFADDTGHRCRTCDFVYDRERPNCPPVARALGWLAEHPERHQLSLTKTTADVLYRLAKDHRPVEPGRHRCRRCAVPYLGGRLECPTLRAVRRELASRGWLPTRAEAGRAICAGSTLWQVDGHGRHDWQRAVDGCHACPLLRSCRSQLAAAQERGDNPRLLIVAGHVFNSNGEIVAPDDLAGYEQRRCGTVARVRGRGRAHVPGRVA